MAVLGLHCCAGSPLIVTSGGYSVVEHRLPGSAVVVHRVSYYAACGTVPNQELNVYLPRWQADSLHWATREAPDLLSKHHLNIVNFSLTLCSACLNLGLTIVHPKPYLLTLPLSLNNMFFIWSVISVKNINQNKALACLKSGWGK